MGQLKRAAVLFDGGEGLIRRDEGIAELLMRDGCVSLGHGAFGLRGEELVEGGGGELDGGEVGLVEKGVGEVTLSEDILRVGVGEFPAED